MIKIQPIINLKAFLNINHFIKYFIFTIFYKRKLPKKVGIISLRHEVNIGNNLIKYAISIIIKQLGYTPYIVGTHWRNFNISFLNKTTNLVIIKNNFSEIKRNDYDVLMVNSDQTWRRFDKDFYDYGFLKFAESWKIKKHNFERIIQFQIQQKFLKQ